MKLKYFLVVLGFILLLSVLVFASSSGCCSKTKSGEPCKMVVKSECSGQFSAVNCSFASFCKVGCCYNLDNGIFIKNVLKQDCLNGKWDSSDPFCKNMPSADEGCCILGASSTKFETQRKCEEDTKALGVGKKSNWKADIGEEQCSLLAESQEEGACVYKKGFCTRTTLKICLEKKGDFYNGYLCTAKELNTTCKPTKETRCVEGKDQVYFKDSCGNPANIYDADKINDESYWEKIILPKNSCNSGDSEGNANSKKCGNCNRFSGGICASAKKDKFKPDFGDYYCKKTSCIFNGKEYKNGDSWCIYDGKVGDGKDVVGSRHWKYYCAYGRVGRQNCADYRNEICAQVKDNSTGKVSARCLKNRASECILYNSKKDGLKKCSENQFCEIKKYNIANRFSFEACVPKVPTGLQFNKKEAVDRTKSKCSLANMECKVIKRKGHFHGYRVVANKGCLREIFSQKLNDFCKSLGDCGGDVNIVGEYGENYEVEHTPRLSLDWIKKNLLPLANSSENQTIEIVIKDNVTNREFLKPGAPSKRHFRRAYYENLKENMFQNPFSKGWGFPNPFEFYYSAYNALHKDKSIKVRFRCHPWEPPASGKNCEKCNGNPLKPCSEYRCNSLGASCKLINKGEKNEMCVDINPNDVKPPKIEPLVGVENNSKYTNIGDGGFELVSSSGQKCLDAYTNILFGIKTNEPARCRYSENPFANFSEMKDFGANSYVFNHTATFVLPDPSHGQAHQGNWTGDFAIYIKCQDTHGNENPTFYKIKSCVNQGPDIRAPRINRIIPKTNTLVSFNSTKQKIEVYTNELSTCRWSFSDEEYEKMQNQFECNDSFSDPSQLGYLCTTELPLNSSENKFYFRCRDQPWLNDTSKQNANKESKEYIIRKPKEKIKIDWINPNNDFKSPTKTIYKEIEVQTSGGGKYHFCSYSLDSYDSLIEMWETGDKNHKQPAVPFHKGKNKIFIECSDETGDYVRGESEFKITYDKLTPEVARIWRNGKTIHLMTNEESNCKYSTEDCLFDWEKGNSTSGGNSKEHTLSAMAGKTYYIKCRDIFKNEPSGCSAVFRIS